jgi:integrase
MVKATREAHRRTRGEGAVYPTADGRMRGSIILPHPDGIRSVRRYVSGRTRADVVRRLDDLRREAAAGFATGETTGAYLARWIVAVRPRIREATHREYARHVTSYWAPLARVPLTRLTPAHVEKAMAELLARGRATRPGRIGTETASRRGLSAMTVRHARSTLRRALHDAQRDGLLTRNVAALARPPRIERREMAALSAPDVGRLVAGTADDPFGPLYGVAVGTGLRLGELLGLAWGDVDLEGRSLVVRRALSRARGGGFELAEPKTPRSRRTVMLPAVALEALRRQKARQAADRLAAGTAWQDRAGLVFSDPLGRPWAPSAVSHAFHAVAVRLALPVRLHDLRHTAASLMLATGVPLKVVSEALGHSSIAITADVYSHVTPDLRREAADAMDRALGGES